ncbi:MAG: hypothetical protein F4Y60_00345 [Boseongicola sp. SB0664_bin_43]|uniref:Uncharacterized protein n=1 Tax=Boseongicola sp. SB0664_bin_43 TaxID=2604844 RepID=A0A6B0XY76_9RHOB|nr:hypothetical protein [Boseongicola sp. SB0664_bin_43]MYK32684.1 hypothetical protein [Boseongicola sp. SB0670_bin_30]
MGLNRMAMMEYLRDIDLARRVFARAEMSNNPLTCHRGRRSRKRTAQGGGRRLRHGIADGGAKAFFFWPKFIVGEAGMQDQSFVLGDCVDMFLSKFGLDPKR